MIMGFNTFPCNPYPISTDELNKGNNDDLNARVATLESDVSDLNSQKANQITIALPFNPETTYEVGDLVYYNGLSYRCTNEHTGEWDADDFAGTTIATELGTLKSGLINVVGTYDVMGIFQTTQLYDNSYGIAIVSGFEPSKHTVSINNARYIDGTSIALTYNVSTAMKGAVGFFAADASALGKLVQINITVTLVH